MNGLQYKRKAVKMSKLTKLEKDLRNATNGITSWSIIQECRTTCPQKLIEELRKKHGYDKITDIWEKRTEIIDGTKTVIRWKKYFWNGGEND